MEQKEVRIKGWLRVLILIVPYLLVIGLFQLFGGLLAGVDFTDYETDQAPFQKLIILLFGTIGTFLIYLLLLIYFW
jgi:hypothetical protein